MSKIADFATAQKAFNDRQGKAIDTVVEAVTGVQGDIKTLNDKIDALQNSAGDITPEDQALLDDLQAQASATSDRLDAAAAALKALDDATPPAPPSTPS